MGNDFFYNCQGMSSGNQFHIYQSIIRILDKMKIDHADYIDLLKSAITIKNAGKAFHGLIYVNDLDEYVEISMAIHHECFARIGNINAVRQAVNLVNASTLLGSYYIVEPLGIIEFAYCWHYFDIEVNQFRFQALLSPIFKNLTQFGYQLCNVCEGIILPEQIRLK